MGYRRAVSGMGILLVPERIELGHAITCCGFKRHVKCKVKIINRLLRRIRRNKKKKGKKKTDISIKAEYNDEHKVGA